MNIFRLAGDMTHLASILILLLKIHATKSCAGVSLRTQELYAIVFVTRYLDLTFHFVSVYNTVMKLVFLGSAFAIVYYMRRHKVISQTYDKDQDTFRSYFLLLPAAVLAVLFHATPGKHSTLAIEILWAFSIYLEAVAILPQLVLLQRTGNVDNLTGNYIFMLGAYRALYLLNWIYRYMTESEHRPEWFVWLSGIVQTGIYCDFFYYYILSWKNNKKLQLPA
eukprot:jgi/Chlat1/8482/Chrsp80S07884